MNEVDPQCAKRLAAWHEHIDALEKVEDKYLVLKASEKNMFAAILLRMEGSTVSEREAKVRVSDEWRAFSEGFVVAHVAFLKSKRQLDLKIKAYELFYHRYKMEGNAVRQHP